MRGKRPQRRVREAVDGVVRGQRDVRCKSDARAIRRRKRARLEHRPAFRRQEAEPPGPRRPCRCSANANEPMATPIATAARTVPPIASVRRPAAPVGLGDCGQRRLARTIRHRRRGPGQRLAPVAEPPLEIRRHALPPARPVAATEPAQPGGDGAHRDTELAGDFLDGEVEPVAKDDDEALLRIECAYGLRDGARLLTLLERTRGLPRDVSVELRQALPAPQQIDGPVGRDPLQPRAERTRLVEAVERAERPLHGVLRGVVSKRAVGGDGVGGPPRVIPVAVEERAGCLCRTLSGEGDQLGVGATAHAFLLRTRAGCRIPHG